MTQLRWFRREPLYFAATATATTGTEADECRSGHAAQDQARAGQGWGRHRGPGPSRGRIQRRHDAMRGDDVVLVRHHLRITHTHTHTHTMADRGERERESSTRSPSLLWREPLGHNDRTTEAAPLALTHAPRESISHVFFSCTTKSCGNLGAAIRGNERSPQRLLFSSPFLQMKLSALIQMHAVPL
jgi:hypothetical protein